MERTSMATCGEGSHALCTSTRKVEASSHVPE